MTRRRGKIRSKLSQPPTWWRHGTVRIPGLVVCSLGKPRALCGLFQRGLPNTLRFARAEAVPWCEPMGAEERIFIAPADVSRCGARGSAAPGPTPISSWWCIHGWMDGWVGGCVSLARAWAWEPSGPRWRSTRRVGGGSPRARGGICHVAPVGMGLTSHFLLTLVSDELG